MPEDLTNPEIMPGGMVNPLDKNIRTFDLPDPPAYDMPGVDPDLGLTKSESIIEDFKMRFKNPENFATDPLHRTKSWSYDPGHKSHNFQRYYAAPFTYKKLGFNPWFDNESRYAKEMNFVEDWMRSLTGMVHIAVPAYTASLPWNAYDGDLTDDKASEAMEKWQAIAHSSRGGIGGFMNNLQLNFGFTAGIIGEVATEELAMAGLIALTAPAAEVTVPAAALRTVKNVEKVVRGMKKMFKAASVLNKTHKSLDAIKDVNVARKLYQTMKTGKAFKATGKFFTPRTVKYIQDLNKAIKRGEAMTFSKGLRGFGEFYMDTRIIAASMAEAKIEGGLVENQIFDQNYAREKKDDPYKHISSEQMEILKSHAYNAGHETFWWNLPMLLLSNKIVLGRSFRGLLPMAEIRAARAGTESFFLTVSKEGIKKGKPVSVIEKSLKKRIKSIIKGDIKPKGSLRSIVGTLGRYTKANLAEGLQETYQESVSKALTDYYTDIYTDPLNTSIHRKWAHFLDAAKYMTTSPEGRDIFLSGFLMGGLAQGPQRFIYETIPGLWSKHVTHRKDFAKYREDQLRAVKDEANAFNFMIRNMEKFNNADMENLVSQKKSMEEFMDSMLSGDENAAVNADDDGVFSHTTNLINSGKLDEFKDLLFSLKNLSADELTDAMGAPEEGVDAKAYYGKQIDSFVRKMETISKRDKAVREMFPNYWNPNRFSFTKQNAEYREELENYMAFEQAIKIAVYAGYSFDRALERAKNLMNTMVKDSDLAGINEDDFSLVFSTERMAETETALTKEINAYKEGTFEQQKEAAKLTKKRDALRKLKASIEVFNVKLSTQLAGGDMSEAITKDYNKAIDNMLNDFEDYVNLLLKENKLQKPGKEQMAKVKNRFLDYYDLEVNADRFGKTYRMLTDPQYFRLVAEKQAKVNKAVHEQGLRLYKESLDKVRDIETMNALLNDLLEIGVYFDHKSIDDFIEGRFPDRFLSTEDGSVVPIGSEKFQQAQDLIFKYEEAHDFTFKNKPIAGEDISLRTSKGRRRIAGDVRNYSDLATQFGFDPNAVESKVPVRDVLQAIVNSKYATPREKALAEALLEFAGPNQKITFRKDAALPAIYRESTGVEIDARYSSRDFGGYTPIEYSILKAQMNFLMDGIVDKDADFAKNIEDIMNAVKEHYEGKMTKELRGFFDQKVETTTRIKMFISAVMSNQRVQRQVAKVKYKATGDSLWKRFLSVVRERLSALFGKYAYKNNALNEAIHLITSKLEGVPSMQKPGKSQEETDAENQKLALLGFSPEDIVSLTEEDREKILKEGIKAEDFYSEDEGKTEAYEIEMSKKITNITHNKDMSRREKEEKLDKLRDEIVEDILADSRIRITPDQVDAIIDNELMSFAKDFTFDDLQEGENVLVREYGYYMIVRKGITSIDLANTDVDTPNFTVNMEDLHDVVEARFSKEYEYDNKITLSPDDKSTSDNNVKSMKDSKDVDNKIKDIDKNTTGDEQIGLGIDKNKNCKT